MNLYDAIDLNNEDRYHISKDLLLAFFFLLVISSHVLGLIFSAAFSFFIFYDYWVTLEQLKDFYGIKRHMNINTFRNILEKIKEWFARGDFWRTFVILLSLFSLYSCGLLSIFGLS